MTIDFINGQLRIWYLRFFMLIVCIKIKFLITGRKVFLQKLLLHNVTHQGMYIGVMIYYSIKITVEFLGLFPAKCILGYLLTNQISQVNAVFIKRNVISTQEAKYSSVKNHTSSACWGINIEFISLKRDIKNMHGQLSIAFHWPLHWNIHKRALKCHPSYFYLNSSDL